MLSIAAGLTPPLRAETNAFNWTHQETRTGVDLSWGRSRATSSTTNSGGVFVSHAASFGPLRYRLRADHDFGSGDTDLRINELYFTLPLPTDSDVEILVGKKLLSWGKSVFFKPINFFGSELDKLTFSDRTRRLEGTPLIELNVYTDTGRVSFVYGNDTGSPSDGFNQGIEQIALSYSFELAAVDAAVVARHIFSNDTFAADVQEVGLTFDALVSDSLTLNGSIHASSAIRRPDKLLALTTAGKANDHWVAKMSLGAIWSPRFMTGGSITLEYFYDQSGLNPKEWSSTPFVLTATPTTRQKYLYVGVIAPKGDWTTSLNVLYGIEDNSSRVFLEAGYSFNHDMELVLGTTKYFGSPTSEFGRSPEKLELSALFYRQF